MLCAYVQHSCLGAPLNYILCEADITGERERLVNKTAGAYATNARPAYTQQSHRDYSGVVGRMNAFGCSLALTRHCVCAHPPSTSTRPRAAALVHTPSQHAYNIKYVPLLVLRCAQRRASDAMIIFPDSHQRRRVGTPCNITLCMMVCVCVWCACGRAESLPSFQTITLAYVVVYGRRADLNRVWILAACNVVVGLPM